MEQGKSDLAVLLPDFVDGWKVASKDRTYNHKNLHDYIDGGAELYLSYGFKKALSRNYAKPGQPDIVADLFDMESSRNAFGVFSHNRETVDKTFGQGSQYADGLLLFWKDHYFVSILASPVTAESKNAVFNLARVIDANIAQEGPLPEILTLLPPQSLVEESIRYFHHYIWLNSHYFVADQNILHIDEKTEALLAKYDAQGRRHILLLVQYQTDKNAELAYHDFARHYLPELAKERVVRIEDGTWTACHLTGKLLIIVFNAPAADTALHLIEAVQNKMNEKLEQTEKGK